MLCQLNAHAANSPPAMIVPGQFNVSATGAATYTIPIAVPPGTAGMVPSLSLDYSSQNGDGIVGIGWTLSGLPTITRCPRTIAQDSVHGGVNYDSNDQFCMDGQRLMATGTTSTLCSGGTGTVFHTEVESFGRIISCNVLGIANGPGYFKVWTKSGQVMEFGTTQDSRIRVQDAVSGVTSTVRAWAVNKVSDTVGNYLTVTYYCALVSGICTNYASSQPLQIDYTGNASAGATPYNSVRFSYANRGDQSYAYQAGGVTVRTIVLTDIKTYQGPSHLVYDYHLGYRMGSQTTHSRLTDVTLCDSDTACSPPSTCGTHCLKQTTFGWQGGTSGLTVNSSSSTVANNRVPFPGDFDGNGTTDVLPIKTSPDCPPYDIYGGPGFTTVIGQFPTVFPGAPSCQVFPQAATVLAPDGTADLMLPLKFNYTTQPTYLFAFNSNQANYRPFFLLSTGGGSPPPSFAGDFNGDGIADILVQSTPNNEVRYGNGTGGFGAPSTFGNYDPANTALATADFDGDGCADRFVGGTTNIIAFSCAPAVSTVALPSIALAWRPVFGDFNGDGKTDILNVSGAAFPANGQLFLATGKGFVNFGATPSDWGKYTIQVGDWNGDGKADLLLIASGASGGYYGSATTHKLYLSTGTGFVQATDSSGMPLTIPNGVSCTTSNACVTATTADWNSDGATDFWLQRCSSGTSPTCASQSDAIYTFSYAPEMITSISNGIGSTTIISYAPLNTHGTLYTKGTTATFPAQDVDGPIYVVSRVDASNGLGTCSTAGGANCYSSTYSYAGAQANLQGRGFLGFAVVSIKDTQTNIVQTTNYVTSCRPISSACKDFPYTGLIASQTKMLGATVLNSTTNTYNTGTGCGSTVLPIMGVYFVCLTQSVVASNDLNGAAFPGITTNYTYDDSGNALTVNASVTDGSSKNTTNTYLNDTTNWFLGRLQTAVVNSIVGSSNLTRHSSFNYDAGTGLLTQEILESGISTCNSGSSSCTLTTSYTYDAFGHRITTTVSGAGITSRTSYAFYDSRGQFQTSVANALGQYEFWEYDVNFGGPTKHTGPNSLTTFWSYDTFGRMVQETRPDSTTTKQLYAYCAGSCPANGQFFSQSETFASDGTTQIGPISLAHYDMLSRSIANDSQGFDGSNVRVATVYDGNGRVQQTSRPYFAGSASPRWTNFAYDALGRVTQATFPDTSQTTYGFNGPTTTVTNSLSQTTTAVKNGQGLTASVTDPASHTTSYVYDAFGNVLTVTDPLGNVVANAYDIRGRKISSADPDMGTWTYAYDVLGELTSQTDAKTQITTLTYDVLGRAITRTEPGLYSAWTYGTFANARDVGQLIEAKACTSAACTTLISDRTFFFDSTGRPIQTILKTPTDYFLYATTYNATNGKIASVSYPSGYTTNRTYNGTGFLTKLTEANDVLVWAINARDAELHITSQTAGNGVITIQAFDPNTGLIKEQRAGSVASFDYAFDTIGNLTSRENKDPIVGYTERFCYDNLNRLTSYNIGAACTGGNTAAYDFIGNITSKGGTGTYTYPSSGSSSVRPHAVSGITGTVDGLTNPNYSYDANGNLTCAASISGCSGAIGRSISMTSFNMAASIAQGADSLSLTYDDQHQRIQQVNTISGVTTTTVYVNDASSGAMSERVSASNATPTFIDYISIDGQVVAQRKITYPASTAWTITPPGCTAVTPGLCVPPKWNSFNWGPPPGSEWGSTAPANPPRFKWGTDPWSGNVVVFSYFNLDHLGSVAVITDQGGNVVQRLSFDPWGKQRNPNGTAAACGTITAPTTKGFTNQEQMPTQCLINLNARLYDSSIGKFMSADPIVGDPMTPNAFNRYSYVSNNPLSFTDPTGLCILGCFWNSSEFRTIGAIFVAVALQQYEVLPSIGSVLGFTTTSTIFAGAVNSTIIGGISGGIASGTLKGAEIGALQGGLFSGAGSLLDATGSSSMISPTADRFVSHGLVGGIVSSAGDNSFGAGFLVGGVASLADNTAFNTGSFIGNTATHAAVGGAASMLGGGKFANGAQTGAFGYLFNSLAHAIAGVRANTMLGQYLNTRDGGIWKVNSSFWRMLNEGRADLINTVTSEIYEIKTDLCLSISYCANGAANQLKDYIHDALENGVIFTAGSNQTVFRGDPAITLQTDVIGVATNFIYRPAGLNTGLIGYSRAVDENWEAEVLRSLYSRKQSGVTVPLPVPFWATAP